MPTDSKNEGNVKPIAFALGGLAGNNAHAAGVLQAALDSDVRPDLISCTSGQLFWVHKYLLAAEKKGPAISQLLEEQIEEVEKFHQPDLDLAALALWGKADTFRLASYEIPLDAYRNMMSSFVNMTHNWGHNFFLKEFLSTIPARNLVPLFKQEFFAEISATLTETTIPVIFNSFDPNQGVEFVHLNNKAKDVLALESGSKNRYRDRTIYKDITPQYVRDGLWIYQYGFDENFTAIDGAYYRQIILSELTSAHTIVVARPINSKWLGTLPISFLALEDMKTEINFNGAYQGERDKIQLINKLVDEGKLTTGDYHNIRLIEIELETQRSFFDYIFEDHVVFENARNRACNEFKTL